MNTKETSDYLNLDPECSKMFYGAYPADKIPNFRSLLVIIVCNTDTSSKREEHWIVCVLTRRDEENISIHLGDVPWNILIYF